MGEWKISALLGILFIIMSYAFPGFYIAKFFLFIALIMLIHATRQLIKMLKNRDYSL